MSTITNGAGSATPIHARGYLGHKLSVRKRADLAAKDYVQQRPIAAPTLHQLATAYRVSVGSIQRRLNGKAATVDEAVAGWRAWTPRQRADFGRRVGVADVWDHAISPAITTERGAAS